MRQIICLIFTLCLGDLCCQPLKTDPYFISSTDTVSRTGPACITRYIKEDRQGNIWLATWKGIMKYDGKVFTNYTLKENLIPFHVFSVFEDRSGNLWFGTVRGGLYKYDGKSFTLYTTEEGLADNLLSGMMEDKNGNMWFGTDKGVSRFDTSSIHRTNARGSVTTLSGLPLTSKKGFTNYTSENGLCGDRVWSLLQDKTGKIWVATRTGVCTYDGKSFKGFKLKPHQFFSNTRGFIEDKSGKIWIGGEDGLYCHDPSTDSLTQVMPNSIGTLFEDKSGNIWLSAMEVKGMALYKYDRKSFVKILDKNQPNDNQIFEITGDKAGNIWFGTLNGPCRYNGTTFEYFTK